MRLVLAAVGRLKDGAERALFDRYAERIAASGRRLRIGPLQALEITESRAKSAAARISEEAAHLLRLTESADAKVALDAAGKAMSSEAFATYLGAERDAGVQSLAFLIGGPDGHGPEALAAADLALSLGPMTLPHGLVRIVLAEQLYRGITILAGHPYHRA